MQLLKLTLASSISVLALCAGTASAQVVVPDPEFAIPDPEFGTAAGSTALTCAGFSITCSTGTTPSFSSPYVENLGELSADSSFNNDFGTAEAYAVLDGSSGLNMAHLSGYAAASDNKIVQGQAYALDFYTYSGPDTSKTLDLNLTATITDPVGSAFSRVRGSIYVLFESDVSPLVDDGVPLSSFSGYFGEGIYPWLSVGANLQAGETSASESLTLDLADGDTFYLYSVLYVGAGELGVSSSLNSMDTSFTDISGLSSLSQVSAVPEPESIALMLLGLASIAGIRRIRRNQASNEAIKSI